MTWYWWLAVAAAGYGSYALWRRLKKVTADQKALEAAITGSIGRAPDHFYNLTSHSLGPRRILAAYIPERKIYIGEFAEPFDPACFLNPDNVRSWTIQWDNGVDDRGRTFKTRFSLHVAVKSIEEPLVRIDCQNEATAYKMREIFDQALGDREVASLA
ncbi:MAG: hypothetical protein VR70_17010 [Rhodospirillaceae bacterium BRH_c57]|nr:MAG: hypothetical protein VR70_17010 [Rhodospirillaceae bacterium BRH_c57]